MATADMLNDGLLRASERLIAKNLAEDAQDVGGWIQNGRG